MREQITDDMLEQVSGGAITYKWDKITQSGTVSSNITGQTFTFGADKAYEVFMYVMQHQKDADSSQMNAIAAIING